MWKRVALSSLMVCPAILCGQTATVNGVPNQSFSIPNQIGVFGATPQSTASFNPQTDIRVTGGTSNCDPKRLLYNWQFRYDVTVGHMVTICSPTSGSAPFQISAYYGNAATSLSGTVAVGGSFYGSAEGPNTLAWGINPGSGDVMGDGFTGRKLVPIEADTQANNPFGSYAYSSGVDSALVNNWGNSGNFPGTAFQISVNNNTASFPTALGNWLNGLSATTGALGTAGTFLNLNPAANAKPGTNYGSPVFSDIYGTYWSTRGSDAVFTHNVTAVSGTRSLTLDSMTGVALNATVTGAGIPASTIVTALDYVNNMVAISNATTTALSTSSTTFTGLWQYIHLKHQLSIGAGTDPTSLTENITMVCNAPSGCPTGMTAHLSLGAGVVLSGTLATPASSTAPCLAGDSEDDTNFHYVCVALNTWKRVALSAF